MSTFKLITNLSILVIVIIFPKHLYKNFVSERFCYDYHLKLHLVVYQRRVKTSVLLAVTKILFAFVIDLKHVSVPLITPSIVLLSQSQTLHAT